MPNKLAAETSPYLLQHQDNPVDWNPWGPEALERSKREQKPIFLSIGYSACHWCHVMEHESFENAEIAAVMNEHFVNIKVDREERPDLDHIYMSAVQLMTGRGGWPMSVFLTPDLRPFYGGTYWPPFPKMGMPGFDQVLLAVADAWQNRREHVLEQAGKLTEHIASLGEAARGEHDLSLKSIQQAGLQLERNFDYHHGGFGGAPKFPHPMDLQLLLRLWKRHHPPLPPGEGRGEGAENAAQPTGHPHPALSQGERVSEKKVSQGERVLDARLGMVAKTLDKMAAGGMYDQLGGGFHRYSVDERWLVPHFEKMLYDNALLTAAYVEAYQATGNEEYARVARETCDYVLRDLTDPAGAFYSTEDADSEGEEGKFYVWTPAEVAEVLGDETAEDFCYVYDVTEPGNFEGQNILNMPKPLEVCAKVRQKLFEQLRAEMHTARTKLLEVRDKRVRPGRDDKVLVAWNGLMIDALARASGALNEPSYLEAAVKAAEFILREMRRTEPSTLGRAQGEGAGALKQNSRHPHPGPLSKGEGEKRLLHTWRAGQAKFDAYLDDYAALANALVSLYEATFDERYFDEAVSLVETMLKHFADEDAGGFFYTADDHEQLIARHKDIQDSSVPSGNSLAATVLVRLGKLTGRDAYLAAAEKTFQTAASLIERAPTATGQMLLALDMYLGPTPEIVLLGESDNAATAAALSTLRRGFMPNKVVALRPAQAGDRHRSPALDALFAGKSAGGAEPTLYICDNFTCQAPLSGLEQAQQAIEKLTAN